MKLPSPLHEGERKRMWHFFDEIITAAWSEPEEDYELLCEAWRTLCKADWIWLFLLDKSLGASTVMQLVAASKGAPMPKELCVANSASIVNWCIEENRIEVVDFPGGDLSTESTTGGEKHKSWQQTDKNGKVFKIYYQDFLRDQQCTRLICTPLSLPFPAKPVNGSSGKLNIKGAVCAYFRGLPDQLTKYSEQIIYRLGLLSSQAILSSYNAIQRSILLELNQIAHNHLTKRDQHPRTVIRNYVSDVIKIIQQHLKVQGVSIFYRDCLRGGVICLGTTGLINCPDGTFVTDFSLVNYRSGEGVTGRCFKTGKAHFLDNGLEPDHKPKTSEAIDGKPALHIPAVIYPIPRALTGEVPDFDDKALGVIRCKKHHSRFGAAGGEGLVLDAIEVQTLDFIARQIAPALETLASQSAREDAVTIVRHDLDDSLGMLQNLTFDIAECSLVAGIVNEPEKTLEVGMALVKSEELKSELQRSVAVSANTTGDRKRQKLTPYLLPNTFFFLKSLLKLVRDLQPESAASYKPEPTYLEGDIVARVVALWKYRASQEKNMTIRMTSFQGVIPKLYVDQVLVERVVWNILSNAIKYGSRDSTINIDPRNDSFGYYVDISNYGHGVDDEDAERIFLGTFRSEWARTESKAKGEGIGLKVSSAIMKRHGGKLSLLYKRRPTTFSLFFPKQLQYQRNP